MAAYLNVYTNVTYLAICLCKHIGPMYLNVYNVIHVLYIFFQIADYRYFCYKTETKCLHGKF